MNDDKNNLSGLEIGESGTEFSSYPEFGDLNSVSASAKQYAAVDLSEGATTNNRKKSGSVLHKILVSATVAVAAVVTAETAGIIGASGISIRGEPIIKPYETGIYCEAELDGYQIESQIDYQEDDWGDYDGEEQEESTFRLKVYNDFETFQAPMYLEYRYEESDFNEPSNQFEGVPRIWGEIYDGLRPDMGYTLEIFYKNESLFRRSIYTQPQKEEPDGPNVVVNSPWFEAGETGIWCSMEMEGYEEGLSLSIVASDGSRSISGELYADQETEDDPVWYAYGELNDLQPGTEYYIKVLCEGYLIHSATVSTQSARPDISVSWTGHESGETEIWYYVEFEGDVSQYTPYVTVSGSSMNEQRLELTGEDSTNSYEVFVDDLEFGEYVFTILCDGYILNRETVTLGWDEDTDDEDNEPVEDNDEDRVFAVEPFCQVNGEYICYSAEFAAFTEDIIHVILLLDDEPVDTRPVEGLSQNLAVEGEFWISQPNAYYTVQFVRVTTCEEVIWSGSVYVSDSIEGADDDCQTAPAGNG